MTIDNRTGEIFALDASAARRRADQIRAAAEGIWQLIQEAYLAHDWEALGYSTWDDYCKREFGTSRIAIPREERSETVGSLQSAGLSQRAISAATGLDRKTIRSIERTQVEESPPPADEDAEDDPEPLADPALHGGGFVGPGEKIPEPERALTTADVKAQQEWEERQEAKRITGVDGKSYPKQRPASQPRERALPDQFFDATYDLTKVTERIGRLAESERFPQNAEKVAAKHRSDLLRARDLLQEVIDRLPTA